MRALSGRLAQPPSLQLFEVACRAGNLKCTPEAMASQTPAAEFLDNSLNRAVICGQAPILRMVIGQGAELFCGPPLGVI